MKNLDKRVPHEQTTNQKVVLKYCLFLPYSTTMNHFLMRLCHETKKWNLYTWRWPAQKLDQEEAPELFWKTQTCTKKKRSWSLFCGLLMVWSTTAFWIPENHYIWEVCSANWWDAPKTAVSAASIGQQKGPKSSPWQHLTVCHTTKASKVEQMGLWSFTYHLTSRQQTTTSSSILTLFFRESTSITSRRQKMLSKSSLNSEQTYFLLIKMCWL